MILVALLAVVFATLLILGYLLFIWWLDRYEREPIWLVGLTFLWGGLGGTCLSCVINSSIGAGAAQAFGAQASQILTTVVVAPTVEEVMKGLIFLPLLLIGNNIDNRTDGLIKISHFLYHHFGIFGVPAPIDIRTFDHQKERFIVGVKIRQRL